MKRPTLNSDLVISFAREYLGTPYRKFGREKGVAIDCVGLILAVGEELGIVCDIPRYRTFNPIDRTRSYIELFAEPVAPLTLGSIAWYGRRPRVPTHFGFLSSLYGNPAIIHADPEIGRVVEHSIPREQLVLIDSYWWFK